MPVIMGVVVCFSKELVNLRDKVTKLQGENAKLRMELENRPIMKPVPGPGENDHVRQQYARFQEENAKLKAQVRHPGKVLCCCYRLL